MRKLDRPFNCDMLAKIHDYCTEIQEELKLEREKNSSDAHHELIERDIITLEDLLKITVAVRIDIRNEMIGNSIELLLFMAAKDFNNKLRLIPTKKALIKEIMIMLETVYENIEKSARK
ncbi:MAG: hypothetical protein HGA36_03485 [Candidatus Moranbacteria bacterium]|nr:hypothetical protein [Candidatus Moranbacteria bacterium]